jgi:hypothetical protein
MLPMRILALGANICFIGYGAMGGHVTLTEYSRWAARRG